MAELSTLEQVEEAGDWLDEQLEALGVDADKRERGCFLMGQLSFFGETRPGGKTPREIAELMLEEARKALQKQPG